ncbi:MAG TPA: indole-3-glycerol-phosphate synthase [Steroidobacteraceae bacterium]|nr:indole-3-glycerol-phosphate synthase [Steroidobacteraceae bacterium]
MSGDSGFLKQMAASSRERAARARARVTEAALLERALASGPAPALRASPEGFDLIAELKLRSPAEGQLRPVSEDVGARVEVYAGAGAAAVSILTEPSRFDGSMAHLELAARALRPLQVPAMRKDFLVDPYQVIEARVAGAGGVLVILRMLPVAQIHSLMDCARQLGMFVLLEAFDEHDIEIMHDILQSHAAHSGAAGTPAPVLAGLNCRDLSSLQIVPERLLELVDLLPAGVPRVAESGVRSPEDARRVAAAGYRYMLVGSALMQTDPHVLAEALLSAGRAAMGSS